MKGNRPNTYIVEREECDYDEIHSMVINANTKKEAEEIASKANWWDWHYDKEEVTIKCVNRVNGILLTSGKNG